MALEAVVFQQDHLFNYNGKASDLYNLNSWSSFGDHHHFASTSTSTTLEKEDHDQEKVSFEFLENQSENVDVHYGDYWTCTDPSPPPLSLPHSSMVPLHHLNEWSHHYPNSCSEAGDGLTGHGDELSPLDSSATTTQVRPKRRRSRSRKNKADIENQRMTHIAVERNRRKQMNEYLSTLRSLMPDSYVQRGDQASIIGGAINFVKELEQRLQWLGGQKQVNGKLDEREQPSSPFSEFFTFPQYSTRSSTSRETTAVPVINPTAENQSAIADIEVTMVESHASLKIRSRRRPKQLLIMVSGLQNLRLTVLHLNVTTVDQFVLYSLSVKVEDDCKLTSVDEISTAVYQILSRIQDGLQS